MDYHKLHVVVVFFLMLASSQYTVKAAPNPIAPVNRLQYQMQGLDGRLGQPNFMTSALNLDRSALRTASHIKEVSKPIYSSTIPTNLQVHQAGSSYGCHLGRCWAQCGSSNKYHHWQNTGGNWCFTGGAFSCYTNSNCSPGAGCVGSCG